MSKHYFFGWKNAKIILLEIFYTLSAQKSKLSAKRLTMFVANNSVIALTWIYVLYRTFYTEFSAVDFALSISGLVGIGTYNLIKSESAKKDEEIKPEP